MAPALLLDDRFNRPSAPRMPAIGANLVSTATDASADYRREARRLRCRLAGRGADLQHALGALARRHDANASRAGHRARSRPRPMPPGGYAHATGDALGVDPASADWFGQLVRDALVESRGILTGSDRRQLLDAGGALGIDRFGANLLIAAVQHRLGAPPTDSPDGPVAPAPAVRWIVLASITVELLIGAIVAGCWLVASH